MSPETLKQTDSTKLKLILDSFKKKYATLMAELGAKEQQIRDLVQQTQTHAYTDEENQALIAQLSMLKARLEQRQQESALQLETEQKVWQSRLMQSEGELSQQQRKCNQLQQELDSLNSERLSSNEYKQHRLEIEKLLAKIDEIDALRATYEKQSLDLIHQVHALEAEKAQATQEKQLYNSEYLSNINTERTKIFDLENALNEVQSQAERDRQRIEKLAIQVLEKDKRIQELQRLEVSLKKAAEQKQELEETTELKKILEEQLMESRQHAEQLERVIQFLRERSEEAHLELGQLREDYQKLQEGVHSLQRQHETVISEKKSLTHQLQNEQREKQETTEEMRILHGQLLDLKERYTMLQKELEDNQNALTSATQQNYDLEVHQNVLRNHIDEQRMQLENFERDSHLIKQTLIRGLREAQEIQIMYNEAVEDKVSTAAKLHQTHQQIERYRDQQKILQDQLDATLDNAHQSAMRFEQLQREIDDQEMLCQQLGTLKRERETLNNEVVRLKDTLQEKESEVTQVQHHFAKKMKEAATFEGKCEEQARIISEQQQALYQNKVKIAELQTSVDMQAQQQKHIQDQLQDAVKSSEMQLDKWEEKYFVVYDKWQAAENRIKELEKLEEKQKHLQGMLANLGSFFSQPAMQQPVPPPIHSEPVPPKAHLSSMPEKPLLEQPEETHKEPSKPYQNLFNMPKAPGRPRQNFLE